MRSLWNIVIALTAVNHVIATPVSAPHRDRPAKLHMAIPVIPPPQPDRRPLSTTRPLPLYDKIDSNLVLEVVPDSNQ